MKEKPKMYQNIFDKEINNNKTMCRSSDKISSNIKNINEIRQKINDILTSPSFIYRALVNIELKDEIIKRKVVGLYNNNLVTIDNEQIPIDTIEDIYLYKEK